MPKSPGNAIFLTSYFRCNARQSAGTFQSSWPWLLLVDHSINEFCISLKRTPDTFRMQKCTSFVLPFSPNLSDSIFCCYSVLSTRKWANDRHPKKCAICRPTTSLSSIVNTALGTALTHSRFTCSDPSGTRAIPRLQGILTMFYVLSRLCIWASASFWLMHTTHCPLLLFGCAIRHGSATGLELF